MASCEGQPPVSPQADPEYVDYVVIFVLSTAKLQLVIDLVSKPPAASSLRLGPDILTEKSPDSGGKPDTVAPRKTGLQESYRLPKRKRTRTMICTYNARTLASEAAIEDLMMQTRKFKYDVIGLIETRRRHHLKAVYETGEELFLGKCESRGVGGV
ncbi:hypothetical protein RB195_022924 [Necator americanus]|uniref:Uncharacterized protein n=1 Tax=Necator americanus TaxID=51031 RepID=A0ABR1EHB7_NECAM